MMKIFRRGIDVWASKRVCVEREGRTLSVQVTFPNNEKAAMVLDLDAANELASILPLATAIPAGETLDITVSESGARNAF